jgi:hypothetical protein
LSFWNSTLHFLLVMQILDKKLSTVLRIPRASGFIP